MDINLKLGKLKKIKTWCYGCTNKGLNAATILFSFENQDMEIIITKKQTERLIRNLTNLIADPHGKEKTAWTGKKHGISSKSMRSVTDTERRS